MTRIYPDPHRTILVTRCLVPLAHTRGITDIAWIDAQTGRPGLSRLNRPAIVEMNISNDRHRLSAQICRKAAVLSSSDRTRTISAPAFAA